MTSAAGNPLPRHVGHAQEQTVGGVGPDERAARRSSRRRTAARAGCARRTRSRRRAAARRGRDPPGCVRPAPARSRASRARAPPAGAAPCSRSRSQRRLDRALEQPRVLDRRGRLQRQRRSAASAPPAVYGHRLGAARARCTPIMRSPTFSGAQIRPRIARVVRRRAADRASTSLTISPMPLAATAPTMPWPRRRPASDGSSSPKPAMVVRTPCPRRAA